VRFLSKSVLRAGQFGFDLPAVAGQPPAAPFDDGSGCRGRLVRADQQWAVAAYCAGEVGDRPGWGAGGAVVGFGQLPMAVGFQPHFGQVGALLEGLLSDGGLVSAVWAGVTAAHSWGGPGRRRGGGLRGGSAPLLGADLVVGGLIILGGVQQGGGDVPVSEAFADGVDGDTTGEQFAGVGVP